MKKAFISFANPDASFAKLLSVILKQKGISIWLSDMNLKGGDRFTSEIYQAINATDVLLVVASNHTTSSQWVRDEFKHFIKIKPENQVIPIVLDDVDLCSISPRLNTFQYIDCHNIFNGIDALCATLGVPSLESSFHQERRSNDRRSSNYERRSKDIGRRLRTGLRLAYARNFGLLTADNCLPSNPIRWLQRLTDGVAGEASKYSYTDKSTGRAVSWRIAIERASCSAWFELGNRLKQIYECHGRSDEMPAVYVLEYAAQCMMEMYNIAPIDRRSTTDRRKPAPVAELVFNALPA